MEKLYGIIESHTISLEFDEDILDEINDVYIEARYPTDLGLIPNGIPKTETIDAFITEAEKIYIQIVKLLENKWAL